MNTTEITEEQVKAWMLAGLADAMTITPRGATSFELKADNFDRGLGTRVMVRIYNDRIGSCHESSSVGEAMEVFRHNSGIFNPAEKAAKLREESARLATEADELEAATI